MVGSESCLLVEWQKRQYSSSGLSLGGVGMIREYMVSGSSMGCYWDLLYQVPDLENQKIHIYYLNCWS